MQRRYALGVLLMVLGILALVAEGLRLAGGSVVSNAGGGGTMDRLLVLVWVGVLSVLVGGALLVVSRH